ncbi:unnamed protein product [Cyprideis torosa]|uniref:Uncharacterized protein n=1 Tax=Cyprideis torosa TaxID=163714 RepID=A0A7R8WIF9_9CRUS|nr:unnamed protein product [Cyprideis torosa]CAG0900696.1 unnamed protein product [Cyprideis torosa]
MRADMAVADLSVTSKRAQAVDFTTPFMSSGLGVLYVAPYQMDPVWFTICECFWYLLASFFLRSSDVAPKALSTRIISLIWWYFSVLLLILYAYTVAHAYSSRINAELSISTVDDLAFQTKISYGTLPNGATEEFFKGDNSFLARSQLFSSAPEALQ